MKIVCLYETINVSMVYALAVYSTGTRKGIAIIVSIEYIYNIKKLSLLRRKCR